MSDFRIDHVNKEIVLNKGFYQKSLNPNNNEGRKLTAVRNENPDYAIKVRADIKKSSHKQIYKGLDYNYMEVYIGLQPNAATIMEKYQKLRLIGKCHKSAFPVIKKWFLNQFPEVEKFGKFDIEELLAETAQQESAKMLDGIEEQSQNDTKVVA